MKCKIFMLAVLMFSVLSAQDTTTITFRIPTARIPAIVEAMKGLYPIPQINIGTPDNPIWQQQFTNNQWPKECIRRWTMRQVARYSQMVARDSVQCIDDTTLIR